MRHLIEASALAMCLGAFVLPALAQQAPPPALSCPLRTTPVPPGCAPQKEAIRALVAGSGTWTCKPGGRCFDKDSKDKGERIPVTVKLREDGTCTAILPYEALVFEKSRSDKQRRNATIGWKLDTKDPQFVFDEFEGIQVTDPPPPPPPRGVWVGTRSQSKKEWIAKLEQGAAKGSSCHQPWVKFVPKGGAGPVVTCCPGDPVIVNEDN